MSIKWIGTYTPKPSYQMVRLVRWISRDGRHKVTLGLRPRLWEWRREYGGWWIVLLGVRLHSKRTAGGVWSEAR